MEWQTTKMDGRLLAAVVLALVGSVCASLAGASPAWAAAEHTPAPAVTPPSVKPTVSPPRHGWSSVDRIIPVALLMPVAPADLAAPAYSAWLIDPLYGSLPRGSFIARGQAVKEVDIFQRVAAIAPTPASSALIASVPLPPKRLVEKRSIILASLAPLPPVRLLEVMPAQPQVTAFAPAPPPGDVATPSDAAADPDANAPQEDTARTIDDGPEPAASRTTADRAPPHVEALIARHADRFDVPASLVRRVAWRESKFDPKRRNGPYWGLMQIRVDTARGLGFRGAPNDLLDADTNMTYAVAYLANAYRVAGRDEKRAVTLYAKGYYYEAKRKRMLDSLIRTASAEK